MKRFIAGFLLGTLLTAGTAVLADQHVRLFVDGVEIAFPEAPPTIINGRTMVPARPLAEALGATVEWDQETRSVIVKSRGVAAMQKQGSKYVDWPTKVPGREKLMLLSHYSPDALQEHYWDAPLQFSTVDRPEGQYLRITGYHGHYVDFPLFGGPEVQGTTDTGFTLKGVLVDGQLYVLPSGFSVSGITDDQGR